MSQKINIMQIVVTACQLHFVCRWTTLSDKVLKWNKLTTVVSHLVSMIRVSGTDCSFGAFKAHRGTAFIDTLSYTADMCYRLIVRSVTLLTCVTDWLYVQLHCWYVLLTEGTFSYTADMCYWLYVQLPCWHVLLTVRSVTLLTCATDWLYVQLHCWHVLLTARSVTRLTCAPDWLYVQLHSWHVLLTDCTFNYTADMCYWLKVRSVTLLTCVTDCTFSYTADMCYW